jgi:acyl dehydratase
MTRTVHGLDELMALAGADLDRSGWLEITQERVDLFADATGDHQWIHVDTGRAAGGPFGGTIAHGYLTLALIIPLFGELLSINGIRMGINYGLNKVRFPQPVKVGSKVRAGAELIEITDIPGGKQAVSRWTVEIDGEAKPACVAEWVTRFLA